MVSKKSGLVLSAIGVLVFLFSVVYISSCTKPLQEFPYSCNGIVCQNGGACDSAKCVCPVGYEGKNCETKTVDKYFGFWKVKSKIIGTDSAKDKNKETTYTIELKATATPTTFFIYNFANNQYYGELVCILDTAHSNDFSIDTTGSLNMNYDHYQIRGGWGSLYNSDSISALVFIRRLNSTVNWQRDTMKLAMKKM
jgi:hypothetical protein